MKAAAVIVILIASLILGTGTGFMASSYKKVDWIVRPADASDKEAVDNLLHLSYSNLLAGDYAPEMLEIALPLMCQTRPELLTSSTWYVVEDPGTGAIVGCGGWTPKSPFGEDIPHLRHFATDPRQLRKGVGKAIWDRTWEDWCKYSASLDDRPSMEVFSTLTAQSFYASLGFEKVKDITIPLREDCQFPAVLMRRPNRG